VIGEHVQQLVQTILKYASVLSTLQASHGQLNSSHSDLRHRFLEVSQSAADLKSECSQLQTENTELREVSSMLSTIVAVRFACTDWFTI
jgi:prefoldin subunit 5